MWAVPGIRTRIQIARSLVTIHAEIRTRVAPDPTVAIVLNLVTSCATIDKVWNILEQPHALIGRQVAHQVTEALKENAPACFCADAAVGKRGDTNIFGDFINEFCKFPLISES
ncbi:hypothetical protein ElyMa_000221500 [Elysia marginata]|uniref:Uncharacterized protein n=1 Tax=Elysia marginata TaxID=1093978 RepID=A0AAV4F154_9GAST|nr:hypothetical protein ElyMa_000221500 [Elysia marginata]